MNFSPTHGGELGIVNSLTGFRADAGYRFARKRLLFKSAFFSVLFVFEQLETRRW